MVYNIFFWGRQGLGESAACFVLRTVRKTSKKKKPEHPKKKRNPKTVTSIPLILKTINYYLMIFNSKPPILE